MNTDEKILSNGLQHHVKKITRYNKMCFRGLYKECKDGSILETLLVILIGHINRSKKKTHYFYR